MTALSDRNVVRRVECGSCGAESLHNMSAKEATAGNSVRIVCPSCRWAGTGIILPPRVAVGYRAKGFTKGGTGA